MKNNQFTELAQLLRKNSTFEIDVQIIDENEGEQSAQVAVWCKSFGQDWSICYQNGDMMGNDIGTAKFNNDGANCGLDQLCDILSERAEFKCLIDEESYYQDADLVEFIHDFCREYALDHKIADHFYVDEDEDEDDEDEKTN